MSHNSLETSIRLRNHQIIVRLALKEYLEDTENLMQLVGFLYNQMQILSFLWFKTF